MRKFITALLCSLLIIPAAFGAASATPDAGLLPIQDDADNQDRRVLTPPETNRRRRIRSERRRGNRGIRSAFAKAGKGAGRGGKRFGQNIAKGRPVRAGKELGKGMGSFGKNVGKGVGRTVERVFKP